MALRTARRLVVRGRPPGRAAGRTGRNKSPRRVGQVGVVESSAHRTVPFGPDQRSFQGRRQLFKHPLSLGFSETGKYFSATSP